MEEAVPAGEGAMAAVLGMEDAKIEEILSGISGAYIANYNCPGQIVITGYEAENPNVNIRVYIDNSMNIIRKISEGTLDVAVIEGNVKTRDVIFKDIFEDEMVLICGKTHPFAGRSSINLTDLAGKAFVLREEGSGTREFLTDLTENRGIPIVEKWICHSSDSIINIVASGQGVSILSKSLLRHPSSSLLLPPTQGIKLFKGHHPHPAGETSDRCPHSPAKRWTGHAPQMRSY